jgi:HK97 family phage major capsid protein
MNTAQLKEAMKAALKSARDIAADAESKNREFTDEETAQIQTYLKTYEDHKKALAKAEGSDAVKAQLKSLGDELGLDPNPDRDSTGDTGDTGEDGQVYRTVKRGESIGAMVVKSAEFKSLMASFPGGRIGEKARVQSSPIGFKSLFTGLSDSSAGAFVRTDFQPDVEMLGRRELRIRDLVSKRTTGSDTVEFVRQLARVNAAAMVAEATSSAMPTAPGTAGALVLAAGGGYKPEGGFTFEKVTATVRTLAEWVPATKRSLADAGQLRGLIDQELREDLAELEENQIVNGDGTGENLTGILQTSGIQNITFATDIWLTTRKAKRLIRTTGRSIPTAWVMNPADWERFDTAREGGTTGAFLGAGPFGTQQPTLWGLPVVESEAVPVNTALIADWRRAVIWDRQQASITMTDSHADFFIRNLVAILAEQREAFGIIRPSAFGKVALV